jgi:hypothetical protein
MGDGLGELGQASPGPQLGGEGIEQAGTRAEDQVDGRSGHASAPGDVVEADRLGGRVPQPLLQGPEDAPSGRLGRLGP